MTEAAPLDGFKHLRFNLELETHDASPHYWMLLGEARSKCDHIKYVPLGPEAAKQLNLVYFAKGVNATTAIEGNTLSAEDVQRRIEGELDLPASKAYLGVEIDNMITAYNSIINAVIAVQPLPPITTETLCALNKQILSELDLEENVVPGELRKHSVAVGPYLAPPWEHVPALLDQLCEWLDNIHAADEADRIPYAFMKAAAAHVYIEWIHPFGDGNGRLGRLVEFLILVSCGVPLPAAHVLTSHYNDTRTEYYRQLRLAAKTGDNGDLRGFFRYAAQGFVDGLTSAIKMLHTQQEQLMWRALVDREFADLHTHAAHRARDLALALVDHDDWIPRNRLRTLTPGLAAAYAGTTMKTLSRDITRLAQMEFVHSIDNRWVRPNLLLVRGLRPHVLTDPEDDTEPF